MTAKRSSSGVLNAHVEEKCVTLNVGHEKLCSCWSREPHARRVMLTTCSKQLETDRRKKTNKQMLLTYSHWAPPAARRSSHTWFIKAESVFRPLEKYKCCLFFSLFLRGVLRPDEMLDEGSLLWHNTTGEVWAHASGVICRDVEGGDSKCEALKERRVSLPAERYCAD